MKTKQTSIAPSKSSVIRVAQMVGLVLLIPLLGNFFIDGKGWGVFDFVIMGGFLFVVGLTIDFIVRRVKDTKHRALMIAGFVLIFLLMWADLAVGIFNIPGISGS